jgi:hypothetical protein
MPSRIVDRNRELNLAIVKVAGYVNTGYRYRVVVEREDHSSLMSWHETLAEARQAIRSNALYPKGL